MFAKVKPQVFLDSLTMEPNGETNVLKAVLKDEGGRICRSFEDDKLQKTLQLAGFERFTLWYLYA